MAGIILNSGWAGAPDWGEELSSVMGFTPPEESRMDHNSAPMAIMEAKTPASSTLT